MGTRARRRRTRMGLRRAVVTLLLIGQAATPAVIAQTATSTLIVRLTAGLTAEQQLDVITRNGGSVVSAIEPLRMYVVEVPAESSSTALTAYRADAAVQSADLDRPREAQAVPNDPGYGSQWALRTIGWDQVYGQVVPSGSSTIAVLDTGVDASTPDLAGRVVGGWSAFGGSATDDPSGHGTAVASIAAAAAGDGVGIAGVAYAGSRILPIQVLDANGVGQDSDIINGVVQAVAAGADVILMAFSSPGYSQALQDAISYAWASGAVLVAATGNDALTTPTFPAGDAKVMGVSATEQDDTLWSGSNHGTDTFIAAPGVGISSSVGSITGTSASAAIVAGAAALLAAADPTASNGTIVGRLARNADPVASTGQVGNGRIDLAAAVADPATDPVVPAGAPPVGDGGPFVTSYTAAAMAATASVNVRTRFVGTSATTYTFTLNNAVGSDTIAAVKITRPSNSTS